VFPVKGGDLVRAGVEGELQEHLEGLLEHEGPFQAGGVELDVRALPQIQAPGFMVSDGFMVQRLRCTTHGK